MICEEQSRGLTTSDGAIIETDQVIISLSTSTGDLHQGKYEEPSRSLKPVEKCQGVKERHSTSPNNNGYAVTEQFQFQQFRPSADDEHPTGIYMDTAIIEHQQKNDTVSEQPQEVIPNSKTVRERASII